MLELRVIIANYNVVLTESWVRYHKAVIWLPLV